MASLPPTTAAAIGTPRLRLEPLAPAHAAPLAAALADAALYAVIGGEPPTIAATGERIERLLLGPADGRAAWCNWAVTERDGGTVVGTVQATVDIEPPATARVAWIVGTPWQRRGYASEAATALTNWLWLAGVSRIEATVVNGHGPSEAVARAAGLDLTDRVDNGERVWAADRAP